MRAHLVLLVIVAGTAGINAQTPQLSHAVSAQVAAAEAEGAGFPRGRDQDAPRRCMIVRPDQIVFPTTTGDPRAYALQSGDFFSGSISFGWDRTYEKAKLALIPSFPHAIGRGLSVRVTRIDPPGETLRFEVLSLAQSGETQLFPTRPTFPTPGKWLIVAAAGVNWGCFVIDRPVPSNTRLLASLSSPTHPSHDARRTSELESLQSGTN